MYSFARLVLTRSAAVLAEAARVVASFAIFTASLTAPSADFTRTSNLDSRPLNPEPTLLPVCLVKNAQKRPI